VHVQIVAIGHELLSGEVADTNTAFLGGLCRGRGLRVARAEIVPDDRGAIVEALERAARPGGLVITSGGLGPTTDDLSFEAIAAWAGVELELHGPTLARIEARFAERGLPMPPNNRRQAMLPAGGTALRNPVGTAPGLQIAVRGTTCFAFPGVPHELERLARDYLLPWIGAQGVATPWASHTFRSFGRTESAVGAVLEGIGWPDGVHVAYRARFPEIQVTLHTQAGSEAEGSERLAPLLAEVRSRLGASIFSEDAGQGLCEVIGQALLRRSSTLALAESCTGGLVAAMLVDVPGASGWLVEAAVTYSNAAKMARLGVAEALLDTHGAVSEPVARAMAEGIRDRAGATYGLSVTGIAGPGGGTPEKPVGTVHLALAGPEPTLHEQHRLRFDRRRNRELAAWLALDMLRRALLP
jgi:nicotinamide-nucleotide amidase